MKNKNGKNIPKSLKPLLPFISRSPSSRKGQERCLRMMKDELKEGQQKFPLTSYIGTFCVFKNYVSKNY
jgi:hypothetical protein